MARRRWVGGLAVIVVALAMFAAGSMAQKPGNPPALLNMPSPQEAKKGSKSADPMADVETFLDRNRKEADTAIQALSDEAESLRARLQKVEAALARWQAVAGALNQESGSASPEPVRPRRSMGSSTPAIAPSPEALLPAGRVRWRQPDPSSAKQPASGVPSMLPDDDRPVPPPGDDRLVLPDPGERAPAVPIPTPVPPPDSNPDLIPIIPGPKSST